MNKPSARSQQGAILPLLVVGLLLVGIFVATGLVQVPQIFKPKAGSVGIQFSGNDVQVTDENVKITKSLVVEVSVNSPYGGEAIPFQRGAQSVKDKNNRVFAPFNLVKEALAMTPTPMPIFKGPGVLSGWNLLTPLPRGFTQGGAITNGDYLFVGGGFQQDPGKKEAISQTMYSAKIEDDGTIGEWRSDLPALPFESAGNNKMRYYNGYIYLVGGENESKTTSNVYSAKIGFDGKIEQWKQVGSLPTGVARHGLVTGNSYMYVVGGYSSDNPTERSSKVYSAFLSQEGRIDKFKEVTSLPQGLSTAGVIDIYTSNGPYIFVAGGWTGKEASNKVYSAKVEPNGGLGEWKEVSQLPSGRSRTSLIADRGHLIWVGGDISYDNDLYRFPQSSVYATKVYEDGSLGEWVEQDPLPLGLTGSSVVSRNLFGDKRDLYVIGGYTYGWDTFVDVPFVYQAKLLTGLPTPKDPPADVATNVRLTVCQSSTDPEGNKQKAGATISWDPAKNPAGYEVQFINLSAANRKEFPNVFVASVDAKQTSFDTSLNPGDVYDFSVRTKLGDKNISGINLDAEHIAVVCGAEDKPGTAAWRYGSDKYAIQKTQFQLYQGAHTFPYLLKLDTQPQFIFADFTNYNNEVSPALDSVTYVGSTPQPSPDNCSPVPMPSCPPGTVVRPVISINSKCTTQYVCVSETGGVPSTPSPDTYTPYPYPTPQSTSATNTTNPYPTPQSTNTTTISNPVATP